MVQVSLRGLWAVLRRPLSPLPVAAKRVTRAGVCGPGPDSCRRSHRQKADAVAAERVSFHGSVTGCRAGEAGVSACAVSVLPLREAQPDHQRGAGITVLARNRRD